MTALINKCITIIGKIIGFLRTIIIAYIFGADSTMDAYNLANGFVLNVLYALSTAVALAFLPIYIEKKVNKGEQAAADFSSKTLTVMSVSTIVISTLVFVNATFVAKNYSTWLYRNEIGTGRFLFKNLVGRNGFFLINEFTKKHFRCGKNIWLWSFFWNCI